jgi:hypothetical protein
MRARLRISNTMDMEIIHSQSTERMCIVIWDLAVAFDKPIPECKKSNYEEYCKDIIS